MSAGKGVKGVQSWVQRGASDSKEGRKKNFAPKVQNIK